MIVFFYFTETIHSNRMEHDTRIHYEFKGTPSNAETLLFENIYFSTAHDFEKHLKSVEEAYKEKTKDVVRVINPEYIIQNTKFPKRIGFGDYQKEMEEFQDKKEVKIGIINAMSSGLGDHLIGMQAFDYWQDQVRNFLPNSNVIVRFFQLSPVHVAPITKRWQSKLEPVCNMPNKLSKILEMDAYIDLGGLILNEGFDDMPMIDFYLKSLSIDHKKVPEENKRNHFESDEKSSSYIGSVFEGISKGDRSILLFNAKSTNEIRSMRPPEAKRIIQEIIDKTDYTVVSASPLDAEYKERYYDISKFSSTLEDFVAIIEQSDALVTVDTSSYHFADAFDIPTVALFTSINPEYRLKYYPFTESIMLEDEEGMLYGKHHTSKDPILKEEQIKYVDSLWRSLDVSEVISKLKKMEEKSKA